MQKESKEEESKRKVEQLQYELRKATAELEAARHEKQVEEEKNSELRYSSIRVFTIKGRNWRSQNTK